MKNGKQTKVGKNKNKYSNKIKNKINKTINLNVQTLRSAPMATYNLTRGKWVFQNEYKLIAMNDFVTQQEILINTQEERKFVKISVQMQENPSPLIIKTPGKRLQLTIKQPITIITKKNEEQIIQINSTKPALIILIVEIITIKPREADVEDESQLTQTEIEIEQELNSIDSNYESDEEMQENSEQNVNQSNNEQDKIYHIIKQNKYKSVMPDHLIIGENYIVKKDDDKYYYINFQPNTQIMWSYEIWNVPHALTNKLEIIDDNNIQNPFKELKIKNNLA